MKYLPVAINQIPIITRKETKVEAITTNLLACVSPGGGAAATRKACLELASIAATVIRSQIAIITVSRRRTSVHDSSIPTNLSADILRR
jgi:hypothetical protein